MPRCLIISRCPETVESLKLGIQQSGAAGWIDTFGDGAAVLESLHGDSQDQALVFIDFELTPDGPRIAEWTTTCIYCARPCRERVCPGKSPGC